MNADSSDLATALFATCRRTLVLRAAWKREAAMAATLERLLVRQRLEEIDEELAELSEDIPGDPGLTSWPPYLAEAFERLHAEREALLNDDAHGKVA